MHFTGNSMFLKIGLKLDKYFITVYSANCLVYKTGLHWGVHFVIVQSRKKALNFKYESKHVWHIIIIII